MRFQAGEFARGNTTGLCFITESRSECLWFKPHTFLHKLMMNSFCSKYRVLIKVGESLQLSIII